VSMGINARTRARLIEDHAAINDDGLAGHIIGIRACKEGHTGRDIAAIDLLPGLGRHRTLMTTPATDRRYAEAAVALLSRDGVGTSLIRDSMGFVTQRVLAMVVNMACEIAQQRIASPADIDDAVRIGLGYPVGPLRWGDQIGAARIY